MHQKLDFRLQMFLDFLWSLSKGLSPRCLSSSLPNISPYMSSENQKIADRLTSFLHVRPSREISHPKEEKNLLAQRTRINFFSLSVGLSVERLCFTSCWYFYGTVWLDDSEKSQDISEWNNIVLLRDVRELFKEIWLREGAAHPSRPQRGADEERRSGRSIMHLLSPIPAGWVEQNRFERNVCRQRRYRELEAESLSRRQVRRGNKGRVRGVLFQRLHLKGAIKELTVQEAFTFVITRRETFLLSPRTRFFILCLPMKFIINYAVN